MKKPRPSHYCPKDKFSNELITEATFRSWTGSLHDYKKLEFE